jgi:ribonucleoside-diphosphate reductase alpha chain
LIKAFLAVEGNSAAASRRVHDVVADLTAQIVAGLMRRADTGRSFHIEDIQDQAELALMRNEHHKVARAYGGFKRSSQHHEVGGCDEGLQTSFGPVHT